MDEITIVNLLTNSGLKVFGIDNTYIYFEDPSCIFPAFDSLLHYAWIVIFVLTAFMLLGWGMLYIKNGVKINTLFNNAKALILIFCILSVVKPMVDFVYCGSIFNRDCGLFAKQCEIKHVTKASVQELLDLRKKKFGKSDQAMLYETFDLIDSGAGMQTNYDKYFFGDTESLEHEYSANQNNISSDIKYVESGDGFVVYAMKDGTKIKRSGGSAAWRNNNPGNIIKSKFAESHGGVGSAGRFAVFPDENTGLNAIISLLRGSTYNSLQLRQVYHKWAPASDGNNRPDAYARHVSEKSGVPLDTVIKDLNDSEIMRVARAMQVIEGWKIGKEERM